MATTGVTRSHQPPALTIDPSENQISTPLQILIVVVTAIAVAALGFLLAGLEGISIGALAGVGLAALWLRISQVEDTTQLIAEELLNLLITCCGPLADPSILWVTGTGSGYLAQMLAFHRLENPAHGPALLQGGMKQECYPLGGLTSIQKECTSAVIYDLLADKIVIALEVEIKHACTLPGDTDILSLNDFAMYLETLRASIKCLICGIDNERKNELKTHFQNKLIPIFSSIETLLQELDRRPQNREFVAICRAEEGEDELFNHFTHYQIIVQQELLPCLEMAPPLLFNDIERDLIDHPCPLVFASTTVEATPRLPDAPDGWLNVTQNVLRFGEDLQYVYTTAPNIERIKSILGPLNVEVRDLKTLAPAVEEQQP